MNNIPNIKNKQFLFFLNNICYLLLVILFLFSCSLKKIESPVIYITNISSSEIRNINCQFPDYQINLTTLDPGKSRSQSFYISSHDKFFGDIKCFWINEIGEKKLADFSLEKRHLPSIAEEYEYPYLQIYLDQDYYEVITSDSIDLINKTQMMEQKINKSFKDSILRKAYPMNNSLISTSPLTSTSNNINN